MIYLTPIVTIQDGGSGEEQTIGRLSRATLFSILLHLGVAALILWLMHASRVTPRAVNRHKITLELNQIRTLPPKPPGARPVPKVPPQPKPVPRPVQKPTPKPLPQPLPKPAPKKAEAPKEPEKKTAKGEERKNPLIAEANRTKVPSETNATRKVIVMKITPKKKTQKPKKKKEIKKPVKKRIVPKPVPPRKTLKTAPRKTPPPKRRTVKRRPTPKGPNSRLIRSLYGSSYSRMSAAQRKFIDENLRRILVISQRTLNYLGYPREAARFGEQGTNVVEFWLHPNGDISGLRLRRRLRSSALNRQTLEVIKTAYMHYPRPKVKTKIIIYVKYRLY